MGFKSQISGDQLIARSTSFSQYSWAVIYPNCIIFISVRACLHPSIIHEQLVKIGEFSIVQKIKNRFVLTNFKLNEPVQVILIVIIIILQFTVKAGCS